MNRLYCIYSIYYIPLTITEDQLSIIILGNVKFNDYASYASRKSIGVSKKKKFVSMNKCRRFHRNFNHRKHR